jgi:hypothetical protein
MELINACEAGTVDEVKRLIAAGANVHANDDYALRWASRNGYTEVYGSYS